jgi:predicted lipid-binding transport protein (Tim44 family)
LEGLVVEIIIFAMIAGFLGLRLYMVLGKRTGAEPTMRRPEEAKLGDAPLIPPVAERKEKTAPASPVETPVEPCAVAGLRAISAADPNFNGDSFIQGAQGAYRMVLEAYWKGDKEALAKLGDADVCAAFGEAIDERAEQGQTLDNRLARIERSVISAAALNGRMAQITVRFDADIAAVTRDKDGKVIAGSLTDAVLTHDVWTFERDVKSSDPNWLLVDTDEAQ